MLETDGSIDFWQAAAAFAGVTYTVGNIHQVRLTLKTQRADGLSLPQWLLFLGTSIVFTAYYAHLNQWMMVSVSVIGTACCATLSLLIIRFRVAKKTAGMRHYFEYSKFNR